MPDATSNLGLRYPTLDDVVTAVDYQNLANDIDTQLSVADGLRQRNLHRPTVSATASSQSIPLGTLRNLNFDVIKWASPPSFSPAGADNFNAPVAGLYFVSGIVQATGGTTLTSVVAGISVNSTTWYQASELQSGQVMNTPQIVKGLVVCNAGDQIHITGIWTGTGSFSVIGSAVMFLLAAL